MPEQERISQNSPDQPLIDKAREMEGERQRLKEELHPYMNISDAFNNVKEQQQISTDLEWIVRLYRSGMNGPEVLALVEGLHDDRKMRTIEAASQEGAPEPQPTPKPKRKLRDIVSFKRGRK